MYRVLLDNSLYPIHGVFDPSGNAIGWMVSYWNENGNYHSIGTWAGYVKKDQNYWAVSCTRMILGQINTSIGYNDTYTLESN